MRCEAVVGVVLGLTLAAIAKEPPWGRDVDGLRVRLEVEGELVRHPGEYVKYTVLAQHVRAGAMQVPWNESGRHVRLRIVGPDQTAALYDTMGPGRDGVECLQWRASTGNGTWVANQGSWRLTDLKRNWWDPRTGKALPVALGRPGTCRIWAEYEVRGKDAPADAWQGLALTNEVVLKVEELPLQRREMRISQAQAADVQAWLEMTDGSGEAMERIMEAIQWTANEGLALRLADIVATEPAHAPNVLYLLAMRAGTWEEPGIDGPYLRAGAEAELRSLERQAGGGDAAEPPSRGRVGAGCLLMYLHRHPDDGAMRDRATKVARGSCRVADAERAAVPVYIAWEILLRARVLREGMAVEEAVQILGQPTRQGDGAVTWYVNTPRHVNPLLNAEVKEGKIVRWVHGRG